ncbi:hypothetical protein BESB_024330 [Besnoitia besnoiti]|uniref:Uncharacterized protein n=1 Tax=Besnoitia besnoiti TaxID=94643 RepID=A0A2A9M6K6_BESBE|nr:hypothetical protein BESB_024330 [Besnoitia besnoiti]PFH31941.1 hypothetical protein BESB_024330 [Besnoitia besnoiti]
MTGKPRADPRSQKRERSLAPPQDGNPTCDDSPPPASEPAAATGDSLPTSRSPSLSSPVSPPFSSPLSSGPQGCQSAAGGLPQRAGLGDHLLMPPPPRLPTPLLRKRKQLGAKAGSGAPTGAAQASPSVESNSIYSNASGKEAKPYPEATPGAPLSSSPSSSSRPAEPTSERNLLFGAYEDDAEPEPAPADERDDAPAVSSLPAGAASALRIISMKKTKPEAQERAGAGEADAAAQPPEGSYVPTPTGKLAGAEEKLAEFFRQLHFIEMATDEHEERQRVKRRRAGARGGKAAAAGSEEEFFSDSDEALAASLDSEASSAGETSPADSEDEKGETRKRARYDDELLEDIVAAELEAQASQRRRAQREEKIAARAGGEAAGACVCSCSCAMCKFCEDKDRSARERKNGGKALAKQVEALLWAVATELSKLGASAEAWRRRSEAALEVRRFDWQAGGLDGAFFLAKLHDLREEIKAKLQEEERRAKLQSNRSALASAFPYSSAANLKRQQEASAPPPSSSSASSSSASASSASSSSSSSSSSVASAGPVSAFSCVRASIYDPRRLGFSPARPSAAPTSHISSSSSSSSSLSSPSFSSSSLSSSGARASTLSRAPVPAARASGAAGALGSGARPFSAEAARAPPPADPPPPLPVCEVEEDAAETPEAAGDDKLLRGERLRESDARSSVDLSAHALRMALRLRGDSRASCADLSGRFAWRVVPLVCGARKECEGLEKDAASGVEAGDAEAPTREEKAASARPPRRPADSAAASESPRRKTTAGVANPLLRKKMRLVERWRRTRELEDEEEKRLEQERVQRELEREQRERQKLEEWKERQIASGEASRNANLIEVKEDWRAIVEKNRQHAEL